jgi:hypothetical protein
MLADKVDRKLLGLVGMIRGEFLRLQEMCRLEKLKDSTDGPVSNPIQKEDIVT